jgi:hypothetical protein
MSVSGKRRLELERARMEALRLEHVREECAALLEFCDKAVRDVRDIAVQQLVASDLRASVESLNDLRGRVAQAPDATRTELLTVASHIQSAIVRADAKARDWTAAHASALVEARQVQAIAAAAGASHGTEAARMGREAADEALRGNIEAATRLTEAARKAAEQDSAATLDERVRREVVKGLLQTLKNMGFVTVGPQVSAGVVVLEGRLASGRRARFDVSLDGQMAFDLDGYEGRSCADDLDKVETTLRDQFGVKLGPPQVVWKNPDRISQGARDLPTGGQTRKR